MKRMMAMVIGLVLISAAQIYHAPKPKLTEQSLSSVRGPEWERGNAAFWIDAEGPANAH